MLKPTEFSGCGHEYGEPQQHQYRILNDAANDSAGSIFRSFRYVRRLFCHEEISFIALPKKSSCQ
jgi:hypothetical protein